MQRLKLFLPLIVFIVLGAFLYRGLSLDPQAMPSALVDNPIPVFALPDLEDESRLIRDSDLLGEVALINVWATWCPSCHYEHAYLNRLKDELGVKIIGINYKDESAAARRWLRDKGNPYSHNIVDADGQLGIDLGVTGAPETYLIDAQGVVHLRFQGPVDERVWRERLAPLYHQLRGDSTPAVASVTRD